MKRPEKRDNFKKKE
jgi:hypothetical protein